jgi:hypothetical protein
VRSSADTWPGPREKLFSCTPWHHRYNRTRLRIDREWAAARPPTLPRVAPVKTDEETCAKTLTHFFTTDWRVEKMCEFLFFNIRIRRRQQSPAGVIRSRPHHFGTDDQDGHAHSRRAKKKKKKKLKIIKMFPDQLMEETELTAGVLIESSRVQTFLREKKRKQRKKNKKRKFFSPHPAAQE